MAEATRDLYERHGQQILSFCLHRLGNREEAEDATQSTFLNAFRGLQRGVSPEFEAAWLYKIAHNVCLTRQRSSWRRRRVETPGDLDAIQDLLPARECEADELIRLPEALEGMPEQQRRALLLREWQGLSYKEIASELQLSQSAVETLLFRARRSLARGLTDEQQLPGTTRRLSAGGNVGSAVAVLKALFVGGGAKIVAATVATVAATSVITTTPAVRHDLVQLLAPAPHSAPAKAKRPTTHPVRAAVPAVVEATRARSGPAQPPLVLPAARRPASGLIVHKQHLVPHPAAAKKAAAPRPPTPAAAVQTINQTSAPDLRHSAPAVPAGRVATEDHGKGKTDQAEPVATPPTHAAPAAKHGHGSKLDAAAVAAVPAATVDQPAKTAPPTDKNHVAKAGGKSHSQVTAVPVPLTNKDPSGKADGKSHGQDTAAPPTDTQDPAAAVATDGQPPAQGAKHDH